MRIQGQMSPRLPLLFALLLSPLAGCGDAWVAQAAGTPAPAVAPLADEAPAAGNQARFVVDGHEFRFSTPGIRRSRARAGEGVVAHSIELANDDNSLYARVVLQVPAGQAFLDGDYRAMPLGAPGAAGQAGVGEVVLAEETDVRRGRRMLPSGSGSIQVRREGGDYVVAFEVRGDDLFRPAGAPAITGELRFSAGT
ncbi:hypothetical protein K3217_16605 [bacterium BD-1]|nr:hypothetical protein [Ottowia caeni]